VDQGGPTFSEANAVKANFHEIYRREDPRAYYTVLGALDYVIPEIARPMFAQLAQHCAAERGRPILILDLGCSYGVNAALMRYGVTLNQLRERYLAPSLRTMPAERLTEYDARYFSGWPARRDIRFLGLDASPEAISYGRKAGLLDAGVAIDLEAHELSRPARELVARADMIISTGCVGYVTERTFEKLLDAFETTQKPWIASFVLRMFDYEKIASALSRRALATEKFPGATFVQRRFRDRVEFEETLRALDALGIDPAGKESEGLLHAELFVSRPEGSVGAAPLTELVSLTSGIGRRYGDRHRRSASERDSMAA
jgi:SAM-dependent methyltransferase